MPALEHSAAQLDRRVVERKTRFVGLCKIHGSTAVAALEGFSRQMKKLPAFLRESLTYDQRRVLPHRKLPLFDADATRLRTAPAPEAGFTVVMHWRRA